VYLCGVMRIFTAKCLLILLVFSALAPPQFREDLSRLPAFVLHFNEHKAIHPEISFWSYLDMHYGKSAVRHQNDHDHSQLPMKGHGGHVHGPAQDWFALDWRVELTQPPAVDKSQPCFFVFSYSFAHAYDIWQPPKRA